MRFRLSKRKGNFGKFNPRNERHGPELVPAADISVSFKGGKRDLDMLLPLQDKRKLSDVFYDANKHLQVPYMKTFAIDRTPENVTFRVWDQATKSKSMLEFEACRIKNIRITMHDKYNVDCSLLIQLHDDPEKHSVRLRMLSDTERDFELEAMQEEIFDEEPEEPEAGDQGDMIGDGQGDEDEGEDEEEEGEEEEEEDEDEDDDD